MVALRADATSQIHGATTATARADRGPPPRRRARPAGRCARSAIAADRARAQRAVAGCRNSRRPIAHLGRGRVGGTRAATRGTRRLGGTRAAGRHRPRVGGPGWAAPRAVPGGGRHLWPRVGGTPRRAAPRAVWPRVGGTPRRAAPPRRPRGWAAPALAAPRVGAARVGGTRCPAPAGGTRAGARNSARSRVRGASPWARAQAASIERPARSARARRLGSGGHSSAGVRAPVRRGPWVARSTAASASKVAVSA